MILARVLVRLSIPGEAGCQGGWLCADQDVIELVELSGIEPLTPCVQGRCSPS
jgi:hypothetical protein